MGGSIKQARKGMRDRPSKPAQPVEIQKTSGAKPKSMNSGKCKGATAWLK